MTETTTLVQPPAQPKSPRYYCTICHSTFHGDAAVRHKAHNDRVYRETRRTTGSTVRRIA